MTDRPRAPSRLRRLRAWLGALPRVWLVVLGGTLLIGAGVAAFAGYTVFDYTMNNPAFCRSCHIMETAWDRWATSEHRKVECHSCHKQSVVESARQVVTFALRHPERVGRHAEVPADRCRACHANGDPRWRQVAETAGHKVHALGRGIECVTCHSRALHRLRPVEQVCANCHQAQAIGARAVKITAMAGFHCVTCHQFLRANSPLRPTRQTCLGCHQSLPPKRTAGWPAGAPHSALPCGSCHKPHEAAKPIANCAGCHGTERGPGHPALPAGARWPTCIACHRPHVWKP